MKNEGPRRNKIYLSATPVFVKVHAFLLSQAAAADLVSLREILVDEKFAPGCELLVIPHLADDEDLDRGIMITRSADCSGLVGVQGFGDPDLDQRRHDPTYFGLPPLPDLRDLTEPDEAVISHASADFPEKWFGTFLSFVKFLNTPHFARSGCWLGALAPDPSRLWESGEETFQPDTDDQEEGGEAPDSDEAERLQIEISQRLAVGLNFRPGGKFIDCQWQDSETTPAD